MNPPNRTCPDCGAPFSCGSQSSSGTCWCGALPRIMPVDPTASCRCPDCLARAIASHITERLSTLSHSEALALATEHARPGQATTEHIDYTFEGNFLVSTPWFLLKQGSCCGNDCRHCPYPQD